MKSFEQARIPDAITRAEMAKMITVYAQTFMQKKTDVSKFSQCSAFSDIREVNPELQYFILASCELGLMGYYANGKDVQQNFRPNDTITRAEVGTLLSRLLRENTYAGADEQWYQKHLSALKKAEIMTLIDIPMMLELRGNMFIMLMRMEDKK
jgi:DNA-binding XRE family transcriptional regulator